LREYADNGVGKLHPSYPAMGSGFRSSYGEHCVEQEDPLASPSFERTILFKGDAQIILYLFIYIEQGRGVAGLRAALKKRGREPVPARDRGPGPE